MISILGISAFYHDSAAVLINDGKIIAAAQEERFTRKKHDSSYPFHAVEFVLRNSKLKLGELDYIAFYEKPFLKFERLLETYVACAPRGFKSFSMSMPIWLREKLFQKKMLFNELKKHDQNFKDINKIYFSEHHFSHAASAFYPSPFKDAVVLTLDGVGEWATTTVAKGHDNNLEILKEIHFPHSIGLLYSAFTYYLGFKVNSGEYKVMGLAPYGKPTFKNLILDNLVDLKDDGTFRLNMKYFDYATGLKMINEKFLKLFDQPVRDPKEDLLNQFHMDIACSIQSVTEEIILRLAKSIAKESDSKNLCMAGGVSLNCVANGKILKEKVFENIWIQPAAGDAGGALGAALAVWHKELKNERLLPIKDEMQGSLLGPNFNDDEVEKTLSSLGAKYKKFPEDELLEITAKELSQNKTIGWFQGRMEFGPRALGARSIIADPRSDKMQKNLNLKVKFRESFRPFAPSVIREDLSEWFELDKDSPYMLLVADINKSKRIEMKEDEKKLFGINKLNIKRSSIPAVTHVDYSARIQTVHEETNPKYYKLLQCFKKIANCPVIVNTSFNVRGEPIVCSIEDAYKCFVITGLDMLICENYHFAEIVTKNNIKFIGPSSEIMKKMSDKIEAKRTAKKLGLPVIEGSEGIIKSLKEAKKISSNIGYPVLIKASAGGGGKGMKLVKNENELDNALSLAKQEAKKYFSNEDVYIEKYVENPRHIEVQILSDKTTTIHIGERDCTVQRKHQKLIEESPSPVLNENTRQELLKKTVEMISKLDYEGVGTVEFIYDNGKFFFIEMNTRIQVEHPVSEIRGGIDIVKEQIKIASKGKTSLKQSDIIFRGHVIECRINAEDPSKNFQPSPGIINVCHQPSGFRTRVDGAIFQGCKITPHYDSLICKLICQGRDREEAIQRLLRSLDEFVIEGITTTIDLHKKILNHKKFMSSDYDVNWLAKEPFY